jgi:uncharacterized membrane protein (DUF106 family)
MSVFDFLVIAVIVSGIVKITSRWFKTKEVVGQRQVKELEQRMEDLQKRISVLEEIFVTEDLGLQRKLRHELGFDSLTKSPTSQHP